MARTARAVSAVSVLAVLHQTRAFWPFSSPSPSPAPAPAPAPAPVRAPSRAHPHSSSSHDGELSLKWREKPSGSFHQTIDPSEFRCELDPKVTAETIMEFKAEIGEVWGSACGRNRGVFVLDPPDGNTYDCGHLPESWGVSSVAEVLTTDPETAVTALAKYFGAVYNTTIVKGLAACDFNGLAYLNCGREEPWKHTPWFSKLQAPIRSVNIGGLFVLEQWILPGFTEWGTDDGGVVDQHSYSVQCKKDRSCQKLKDHWKSWYSLDDFKLMKKYGLNTIRLPVGYWYFAEKAGVDSEPYVVPDEDLFDEHHPITDVMRWANEAGLHIIFDLHGAPDSQNSLDNSGRMGDDPNPDVWGETWLYDSHAISDTVKILDVMARYLKHTNDNYKIDNVILVQLVNEPWVFLDMGMVRDFYVLGVGAIREVLPDMPILLHDSFHGDLWHSLLKYFPYDQIYLDTHLYHGFNTADIASDSYEADKLKMFVHEKMSCAMTAMLRFETCSAAPVLVGEWSLAIDNCMDNIDRKFKDYGQCDRLEKRSTDPWWKPHIKSFAHRQMDVYERELGWSFWTWKLDEEAESTALSAPLWSFRLAVEKGFIDTSYPEKACLHNPEQDYQSASPLLAEESVDAVMPHYNKQHASVESSKRGSSAMGVMSAIALVATLLGLAAVVFVLVARETRGFGVDRGLLGVARARSPRALTRPVRNYQAINGGNSITGNDNVLAESSSSAQV